MGTMAQETCTKPMGFLAETAASTSLPRWRATSCASVLNTALSDCCRPRWREITNTWPEVCLPTTCAYTLHLDMLTECSAWTQRLGLLTWWARRSPAVTSMRVQAFLQAMDVFILLLAMQHRFCVFIPKRTAFDCWE